MSVSDSTESEDDEASKVCLLKLEMEVGSTLSELHISITVRFSSLALFNFWTYFSAFHQVRFYFLRSFVDTWDRCSRSFKVVCEHFHLFHYFISD